MLSAPERPTTKRGRRAERASVRSLARTTVTLARHASECVERERLIAAIQQASERRRLVLALLLVERLTFTEAANVLGIGVSSARALYREAWSELRRAVAGERQTTRSRRVAAVPERLRKAS